MDRRSESGPASSWRSIHDKIDTENNAQLFNRESNAPFSPGGYSDKLFERVKSAGLFKRGDIEDHFTDPESEVYHDDPPPQSSREDSPDRTVRFRLDTKLWCACRDNQIRKVRKLLKEGADVNVERDFASGDRNTPVRVGKQDTKEDTTKHGHEHSDKECQEDSSTDGAKECKLDEDMDEISDTDESDNGSDSDGEILKTNPIKLWEACRKHKLGWAKNLMWYYKLKRKHQGTWKRHGVAESDDSDKDDKDKNVAAGYSPARGPQASALYVAIHMKNYEIALLLLEQKMIKPFMNRYGREGQTVLNLAVLSPGAQRIIRLPSNNMTWVNGIVTNISKTYPQRQMEENYYTPRFVEETRCARDERGSKICLRFPHVQSQPMLGPSRPSLRISLVIPFIDFESVKYLKRHDAGTPLTDRQKQMSMLEYDYGVYCGADGIQLPQTLDQFYYGGLQSANEERNNDRRGSPSAIKERNDDQILLKWWKLPQGRPHSPEGGAASTSQRTARIFMVPDGGLLVDLILTVKQQQSSRRYPQGGTTNNPVKKVSLRLRTGRYQRTFLDEFQPAGVGVHILEIYESWIAYQEDLEVKRFREFMQNLDTKRADDGYDHESLKIGVEPEIIYELKDALEELFILKQLFTNQREIAKRYHTTCILHNRYTLTLDDFIQKSGIQGFIDKVERLEQNAKRALENKYLSRLTDNSGSPRTRHQVNYLVQVKQAQRTIMESKQATEEANRSRMLNNYVLLLTIVTIVYTPLAFMAGLFALSIDDFPRDDKGGLLYGSLWITGRFFAGEHVSISAIAIGAFGIHR
ncbi:hypothetical protein QBC35DRAFT_465948 [Podospora australis]|uniref:Ankyrin repeat protein n=1 Tax=Podospora australis TaxID=1536484 RepID=A0AAN6WPH5_9PEZI|nr:hypothetical protein QBC35DRAFT_465948 [Podospora australis]